MHEFSIALNIVEIAIETAKTNKAVKINEVIIEVGDISGVVYEALELALQSAVKNSLIENSHIVLNRISAKAVCKQCNASFEPENLVTICPACRSFDIEILSGKEMKVKSIQIE